MTSAALVGSDQFPTTARVDEGFLTLPAPTSWSWNAISPLDLTVDARRAASRRTSAQAAFGLTQRASFDDLDVLARPAKEASTARSASGSTPSGPVLLRARVHGLELMKRRR